MTRADDPEQLTLSDALERQQRPSVQELRAALDMRPWSTDLADALDDDDDPEPAA